MRCLRRHKLTISIVSVCIKQLHPGEVDSILPKLSQTQDGLRHPARQHIKGNQLAHGQIPIHDQFCAEIKCQTHGDFLDALYPLRGNIAKVAALKELRQVVDLRELDVVEGAVFLQFLETHSGVKILVSVGGHTGRQRRELFESVLLETVGDGQLGARDPEVAEGVNVDDHSKSHQSSR